jgi:hypothetical protein
MSEYIYKYVHKTQGSVDYYPGIGGRVNPSRWCYPDPETRDQYYGWLKHRAQAKFRGEDYTLTKEEWFDYWKDGAWAQRGRQPHNLSLVQIDPDLGWHKSNCEVVLRIEYLRRSREYRARKGGCV